MNAIPTVQPYKSKITEWIICLIRDAIILRLFPILLLTSVSFLVFGPIAYAYKEPLFLLYPIIITLLVPIGLLFRFEIKPEDPRFKESFGKQYEGWKYIRLPKLFYIFDNTEVGAMGDFTWPKNAKNGVTDTFFAMWWWLAIRNPINNLQQLIGLSLREDVKIYYEGDYLVDSGEDTPTSGWHFVKCICGNRTVYGFYLVKEYKKFPGKCLRIRMGYKIKPGVKVLEEIKQGDKIGTVFVIVPYKQFGPEKKK